MLKPQDYTHYRKWSPQCTEKIRFTSDDPIDEKIQKHPEDQKRFCTCLEEAAPIGHVQTWKMKKSSGKVRELRMISFKGGGLWSPNLHLLWKITPIMRMWSQKWFGSLRSPQKMKSLVVAEKCSGHAQKGQRSSAKILEGKAVSWVEGLKEAFQKPKCSLV